MIEVDQKSNSKEHLLLREADGILFIKQTAVKTQSTQRCKGMLDWNFKALAKSKMCWCFFSTTTFYWGVSPLESWCKMLFGLPKKKKKEKKKRNSSKIQSHCLFFRHLIFFFLLNCVST